MAPRILIVDDEPLIRLMLAEAFADLGLEVSTAENGDAAWSMLSSGQQFDLVFTDHVMPGSRSGAQLVEDIRASFPHIRAALASAYLRGEPMLGRTTFEKPYDVVATAKALIVLATTCPSEKGS